MWSFLLYARLCPAEGTGMKYSESLKKNNDFKNVYRNGKSYANRYLVMYVLANGTERNRLGISVSKKVGNSVIRHHLTRLVRESYRLHEDMFVRWLRHCSNRKNNSEGYFLPRGGKRAAASWRYSQNYKN